MTSPKLSNHHTLNIAKAKHTKVTLNNRWRPIWTHIAKNIVTIDDYEQSARAVLPQDIQALLFENTLNRPDQNAIALDKLKWLPQVLNPNPIDTTCHLNHPNSAVAVDLTLPHPLWLSPVAHHALFHPDAEFATLEACQVMHTPSIWSCLGNTPFEQLFASSSTRVNAAQWYWQPLNRSVINATHQSQNSRVTRRHHNLDFIDGLVAKGLELLVITVDAPHAGVRSTSRRAGAYVPSFCRSVNLPSNNHVNQVNSPDDANISLADLIAQAPTWDDIQWLVARCNVPVFLKGIMHPTDAQRAKDIGCAGIMVSNHGNRVLADIIAVIDILPKIREQVGDDMIIIADGGIRSGSDMAKMIALGADAVAIGRGYMYGLAMAGALGVAHVNKILLEELQVTMALLGCADLSTLKKASLIK